ncbi:MAG: hypothetical protein JWN92_1641 [Candidatus Acidoferrum typicum]|nr:hypothetical protein [Candidatus Acidoferrum typicum]
MSSSHQISHVQKRRSTRLDHAVPVAVQGVGAYREPYQDQVSTLSISCHGCTYNSKYEVIQGELVYLDVRSTNDGSSHGSSRARVKWVQNLGGKVGFQVAVELEVAGNIWGIASPPEDWFPISALVKSEQAASGRELRLVAKTEQQNSSVLQAQPASGQPVSPTSAAITSQGSQIKRNEAAASPLSSLTQLMAGLGEQMQILATEAARTALAEQKGRLLEDFRSQLRQEAIKAMQSVILASKEDFTRLALKELNLAHEAGARANYTRWMEKIGQDMESARQHMLNQTKEVSQRVDSIAATTVERVQRSMEATRSEAVERFVSRLKEQVAPILAEAKDALQTLTDSGAALKKESQSIRTDVESKLATATTASLVLVQDQLDQNASAVAAKTQETLLKLSENFESTAREHVESLLVSMGANVSKTLQERTAEISREFSAGLEGYTRNYLEFISKAIAEIPKTPPAHSQK